MTDCANLHKFQFPGMRKILLVLFLVFYLSDSGNAQIDTNTVVYSWKLDESLANRIRVDVDTALENFQSYNPAFRMYTGVQTLGNYGLPATSVVYTERPENEEFLLINNFMPFMKQYQNTRYFNSRKPFTRLSYLKGGSNQTKEEILNAFHSQNLTKTLNFGIHYTTIGSLGHYKFQKVKNNSFNFFSSLSGKLYSYQVSINYNKIISDENGGVPNDSLITDSTFIRTKDIPTLFNGTESSIRHEPDVYNEIKNINILAVQELSFRNQPKVTETAPAERKKRIFYPKLVYIFNLDRTTRRFRDVNPQIGLDNGLYSNTYVSNVLTSDSLLHWKMGNAIRLQFQGRRNNHYYVDYSYELMKYAITVKSHLHDSLIEDSFQHINQPFSLTGIKYTSNMFNSYLSSGFSKIFAERLDMNLYGRYFFTGYRTGDTGRQGNKPILYPAGGAANNPLAEP